MTSEVEPCVAIAIVRSGDRFLVGTRPAGVALAGLDEFPGGKCKAGESPEACVVRECLEETGVAIRVVRLRCEFIHPYPHGRLRLHFFDCAPLEEQTPTPPFRWVHRAELANLRFPDANEGVLWELLGETEAQPRTDTDGTQIE